MLQSGFYAFQSQKDDRIGEEPYYFRRSNDSF
jgi:hypothetical protein